MRQGARNTQTLIKLDSLLKSVAMIRCCTLMLNIGSSSLADLNAL